MIYLLLIYVIFYILWSLYSIREDLKTKAYYLVVLQIIALIIGATGMVLYTFSINEDFLKDLWKGLFILMVLGEAVSFDYDFKDLKRDPEISKAEAIISILIGLALMVPALLVNYLYAFTD